MRLTLIQNDSDGGARLLFSRMPDTAGYYRDRDETVVRRAIGDSVMPENAGVAAMNATQADIRTNQARVHDAEKRKEFAS